jgi:hypothetical protein
MSDLQYYITAKSKGKKPYVMFLQYDSVWGYQCNNAQILDFSDAENNAKHQPTHCLFVEAKDGWRDTLSQIFEKKMQLSYDDFQALIKTLHCKTISTRKAKKPKTQAAPAPEAEPAPKKRIGYLLERDTCVDKPYFCSDARCENIIEWDGISVQIFLSSEYAQFIADLQYIETGIAWQVKPAFR